MINKESIDNSIVDKNEARLGLLQSLSVEALVDAMNPMSYQKVYMEGVRSLFPGQKLVGQAVTLRFLPVRPDLKTETRLGEDSPEYKAIEACGPGKILVADAMGLPYASIGGDIKFSRLEKIGAAGIITDGAIRDAAVLRESGLQLFARGVTAKIGSLEILPFEVKGYIQCGGVLVKPYDYIVAEHDGVVVISQEIIDRVIDDAIVHEELESVVKKQLDIENVSPGKYYPFFEGANLDRVKKLKKKFNKKPD